MFLPKKNADLPVELSVLESLRAQEKSLKREKKKAAKERRQHAKQLKKAEKHAKKRIAARKAPQKASDCLQYLSMSQDGICEVEPGLFSMTMAFTDVNFQIAMLEEQKNIFTKYSEFLNYFDPSLHLEINLVTRSMDEEQFRRDTFLPLRGNDRDRYAEEMNQVAAEKALRGQNGLIREKYVTFSLHAENYQHAKEQLENRAADIADHFKRMGSSTRILSGIERLSLLQGIMRPNEEMSFSYDWLLAEDDLTTKDFISPSSYNWHPEHDETVVLLSHKKADSYIHIDVEFGEGEGKIPVDSIAKRAEAYKPKEKVTYKMIKEYIEAKYGFKVHTAYIAEVKRNLGLPMYDAPNAVEELKQPRKHPTPEKVEAIKDALRYFAVI